MRHLPVRAPLMLLLLLPLACDDAASPGEVGDAGVDLGRDFQLDAAPPLDFGSAPDQRTDMADAAPCVRSSAYEACDGVDEDCDGIVDEDVVDCVGFETCVQDAEGATCACSDGTERGGLLCRPACPLDCGPGYCLATADGPRCRCNGTGFEGDTCERALPEGPDTPCDGATRHFTAPVYRWVTERSTLTLLPEDLDSDGDVDLIAWHPGEPGALVRYDNLGDGEFSDARIISADFGPGWPNVLGLQDLDQDGRRDLVVGARGVGTRGRDITWWPGTADGFGPPRFPVRPVGGSTFNQNIFAAWRQLDAPEMYTHNRNTSENQQIEELWVWRLEDEGLAPHRLWHAPLERAESVLRGGFDFDGDGRLDLLAKNDARVRLLLGTDDGFETGPLLIEDAIAVSSFPVHGFRAGDFDGDGDVDLLLRNDDEAVYYENLGELMFSAHPLGPMGVSVRSLDLDLDGDLDPLFVDAWGAEWLDDAAAAPHVRPGPVAPDEVRLLTADLDGDGLADVLMHNRGDGEVRVDGVNIRRKGVRWFSSRASDRDRVERVRLPGAERIEPIDLDGDAEPEWLGVADGELFVWEVAAGGTTRTALGAGNEIEFTTGLVDANATVDIVTIIDDQVSVFLNDGTGAFERVAGPALPEPAFGGHTPTLLDVTLDGLPDLLVGRGLLVNQSAGRLGPFARVHSMQQPRLARLVAGAQPDLLVLRDGTDGSHGRVFVRAPQTLVNGENPVPRMLPDPAGLDTVDPVDIDRDGLDDLVGLAGDSLVVWHNDGGHRFSVAQRIALPALPRAIDVVDLDHDGALDVAVSGFMRQGLDSEDGYFAWWSTRGGQLVQMEAIVDLPQPSQAVYRLIPAGDQTFMLALPGADAIQIGGIRACVP